MWQLMLNLALIPAIAKPTNLYEHKCNGSPQGVALSYLSPYKPGSLSSTTTVSINGPHTTKIVHDSTYMSHKVHRYSSFIRVRNKVITNQV